MNVIITGGTGFVGTNLLSSLRDHNVMLIDNLSQSSYNEQLHAGALFRELDIRDPALKDTFLEFKPDVVFHFGGLVSIYDCHRKPHDAVDNNIVGTLNVFEAALHAGCPRVIFSETSAVYEGCSLPTSGYCETQSNPTTLYATTKAAVALIAESYDRTKGLRYTALRYFNIAGPVQDYRRTVPPLFAGIALRLLGGRNPIIFGDGKRRRDFIHVDDINAFHLQCMTDDRTINKTYNLGLGKSYSLHEIAEKIHRYLGISSPLAFDVKPEINGEAFAIYANIHKATSIGWQPKKSIDDCISDTVEYLLKEISLGHIDVATYMQNIDIDKVKI